MADGSARVCPTHKVELEERPGDTLYCPAGRHEAKRWLVINRRNSRAEYEATTEKGATLMPDTETVQVTKHEPKCQTLDRAKFEDDSKAMGLFVRLTKEPKRLGGDPFYIRWQQWLKSAGQGKKGTLQGVVKTCPDEASGRRAFKVAVSNAIEQGWSRVQRIQSGGGRCIVLKPIPAPTRRRRAIHDRPMRSGDRAVVLMHYRDSYGRRRRHGRWLVRVGAWPIELGAGVKVDRERRLWEVAAIGWEGFHLTVGLRPLSRPSPGAVPIVRCVTSWAEIGLGSNVPDLPWLDRGPRP